MSFYN